MFADGGSKCRTSRDVRKSKEEMDNRTPLATASGETADELDDDYQVSGRYRVNYMRTKDKLYRSDMEKAILKGRIFIVDKVRN